MIRDDDLAARILSDFNAIICEPDMEEAQQRLHVVAQRRGLGVALLVQHQRGLASGHIPRTDPAAPVQELNTAADRFRWVHAPGRALRGARAALVARGIMSGSPDPRRLIYHENDLIGAFSFNPSQLVALSNGLPPQGVVDDLLSCLAAQGLVRQMSLDSRQIRMTDSRAAEAIRAELERHPSRTVFVRAAGSLSAAEFWLPDRYDHPEVRQLLKAGLERKHLCNYCSVRELNPREDIAVTGWITDWERRYGFALSRSYDLGFTFAAFGEPSAVCHFLAWDSPAGQLIRNMDSQACASADLLHLTCAFNKDIAEYCATAALPFAPLAAVCNFWGGNSVYHFHYQFFRLPDLPLTRAAALRVIAIHAATGLTIERLRWPTPAYRIVTSGPGSVDALAVLADAITTHWDSLPGPQERIEIGNGMRINNHTQNLLVFQRGAAVELYFIPRLRSKLDTAPRKGVAKANLAALETAGYLIVDEPEQWQTIVGLSPEDRNEIAERALADVAPDATRIRAFEDRLRISLAA